MKRKAHILLITIFLIFVSCKTAETPYCIGKATKSIKLYLGTILNNETISEQYLILTDRYIYRVAPNGKKKKVVQIPEKEYCDLIFETNEAFLKTQVINEVGDTLNFIQFENPSVNLKTRAIWNPKFNTRNSENFRKLFEQLEKYVKK